MKTELQARLSQLSVDELSEIAARMDDDMREEAGSVLDAALSELERKMPESDFVRFCEKLLA